MKFKINRLEKKIQEPSEHAHTDPDIKYANEVYLSGET